MTKELVHTVHLVELQILQNDPLKIKIKAVGYTTTSGWKNPELDLASDPDTTTDGIYEFNFQAEPPPPDEIVLQMLTPITVYKEWSKVPAGVKGIRVGGEENALEKFMVLEDIANPKDDAEEDWPGEQEPEDPWPGEQPEEETPEQWPGQEQEQEEEEEEEWQGEEQDPAPETDPEPCDDDEEEAPEQGDPDDIWDDGSQGEEEEDDIWHDDTAAGDEDDIWQDDTQEEEEQDEDEAAEECEDSEEASGPPAEPGEEQPQLEILGGLKIINGNVILCVTSHGTTVKEDFCVNVIRGFTGLPPFIMEVYRLRRDPGKALVPGGVELKYTFPELGITSSDTFILRNLITCID